MNFNKIKSTFTSSGDTIESLQSKTKSILSIFDKTKSELQAINNTITAEEAVRESLISKAEEELTELRLMLKQNEKVINNITNLIS